MAARLFGLAAPILACAALWELAARAPGTVPDILALLAAFAMLAAEINANK